ncbi:hypothetical protein HMI54_002172 [Coelomomyces lativittatus]|nr:hypothetical protein HMI54_002172 [Coelomomyces lativittatus]
MGLILWKPRKLRKSRNLIFLLNLAFSDVALSAFLASFNAVKHVHDPNYLDEIICPLEGILNQVVGINALMSVMLLALDRYMIVVKKITIRTRYCLLSILVVTIISIIAGLSPWLIDKNAFVVQPSGNYCLLDLSKTNPRLQGIENAPAVAYGTALLITLCCYFFIIVEIRSVSAGIRRFQSKKLMDSQPELANGSQVLKTTETQELSSTLQIWRSQHGIAEKKSVKNWAAKFFSTLGPKNSQPPSTTLSNEEHTFWHIFHLLFVA